MAVDKTKSPQKARAETRAPTRRQWIRWYLGTVSDPKFRMLAAELGVGLPDVVACWAALLEVTQPDGRIVVSAAFNGKGAGMYLRAALDLDSPLANRIVKGFVDLGILAEDAEGLSVTKFQQLQYSDTTNAERQARHRDRHKDA